MKYNKFIEVLGSRVSDISFVSKAQSKDDTRYMMNFMYCEDNKIIATDGRRAHMVGLTEDEILFWGFKNDTFYKFLKGTKSYVWLAEIDNTESNMIYPNIKRVIPGKEDTKTVDFINPSKRINFYENLKNIYDVIPRSSGLDIGYLFDLPKDIPFKAFISKELRPILLESNSLTAVIMPRMLD